MLFEISCDIFMRMKFAVDKCFDIQLSKGPRRPHIMVLLSYDDVSVSPSKWICMNF